MWSDAQEQAFTRFKHLLAEAPNLVYFDLSKQLCDASNYGMGSALLQDGRPIAYASRALTDAETRYASIEKERLAIIFALKKWYQFTYGRPILVYSDHKTLDIAPKRLQGMLLRALAYDIDVKYLESKKISLADTLSCAYLPAGKKQPTTEFEAIHAVNYLPLREDTIQNIRNAAEQDSTLQVLKAVIQHGWPDKSNVPPPAIPYYNFRDAVAYGLMFRGERLVILHIMRSHIKRDIHIGHVGIEGCLIRERESVYWLRSQRIHPNM